MPTQKIEIYIDGRDGLSKPAANAAKSLGGLEKAAKTSGDHVMQMGAHAGHAGSKLDAFVMQAQTAGMALTMLAAPFLALGLVTTKLAMDAVESENLFSVSMGEMEKSARDFSENMRQQFGLNSTEIRRQIGTFNVMFGSMGIAKQGAYDMATSLTQLTYDMSSFYNIKPDEMFLKLQAAISGEVEPLRRLGVTVNETTIEQWAMNKGLAKSLEQMSEAQKVVARYNVILEQTKTSQGDLARTIESPANQLRAFGEQLKQTGEKFGEVFLPELSKGLKWLRTEALPRTTGAVEALGKSWGLMSDEGKRNIMLVSGLLIGSGPLISAIGMAITGVSFLARSFMLLGTVVPLKMVALAGGIGAFGIALQGTFNYINRAILETTANTLKTIGVAIASTMQGLAQLPGGLTAPARHIRDLGAGINDAGLALERMAQRGADKNDLGDQIKRQFDGALKSVNDLAGAVGSNLTPEFDTLLKQLGQVAGSREELDIIGKTIGAWADNERAVIEQARVMETALMGFYTDVKQEAKRTADLWADAPGLKVDAEKLAKVQKQIKDLVTKSAEAFWKLDEDYGEAMGSIVTKHGNAMLKIGEDEEKATAKFRDQVRERTTTYNEAMGELKVSHEKTLDKLKVDETKATAHFQDQVRERTISFNQSMADMEESHRDTIQELKAQLADLEADWDKAFRDREADYAQERKEAPDRYLREKEAAKDNVEFLKKAIADEEKKGKDADQVLLISLRQRLAEEEAAVNQNFSQYLQALTQRQLAEKEQERKAHAERQAEIQGRITEEEQQYAKKTAAIKREYDKDLANYRQSLAQQKAELATRRAEEDAEYATREGKLKTEFDKDVANYAQALADQKAEFVKKRAEEEVELAIAMQKRKNQYDLDVAEVQSAEAQKLQALKDRLAEEAKAKAGGATVGGSNATVNITVPGMAAGAIVTRPTLAVIGERYRPEAVVPLDNRIYNSASVLNQCGGGIDYERLAAALATQPIVLRIDGEQLVVRGYEQARRRGRI